MTDPASTEASGRELDDDHDLLTYNESGARLREEITKLHQEITALPTGNPGTDLRERLELLTRTADHNEKLAANDKNGAGFLRYAGPGTSLNL